MSRRYTDAIKVRSLDDVSDVGPPKGFIWRGRHYRVRSVIARWVEADAWWRRLALDPSPARVTDPPGERTIWRVEAVAGSWIGVYDICRIATSPVDEESRGTDPADPGSWFLARSFD